MYKDIIDYLNSKYDGRIECMMLNKQIVIVNDCIQDNAESTTLLGHNVRLFNVNTNEQCHAQKDGDCIWQFCPQTINSKNHCPIDCYFEED